MKKILEILEISSFDIYSIDSEKLMKYIDILKEALDNDPDNDEIIDQINAFIDELEIRGDI